MQEVEVEVVTLMLLLEHLVVQVVAVLVETELVLALEQVELLAPPILVAVVEVAHLLVQQHLE
jgi:hypothetical protein